MANQGLYHHLKPQCIATLVAGIASMGPQLSPSSGTHFGSANAMTHACFCCWDLSDLELLSHFDTTTQRQNCHLTKKRISMCQWHRVLWELCSMTLAVPRECMISRMTSTICLPPSRPASPTYRKWCPLPLRSSGPLMLPLLGWAESSFSLVLQVFDPVSGWHPFLLTFRNAL